MPPSKAEQQEREQSQQQDADQWAGILSNETLSTLLVLIADSDVKFTTFREKALMREAAKRIDGIPA